MADELLKTLNDVNERLRNATDTAAHLAALDEVSNAQTTIDSLKASGVGRTVKKLATGADVDAAVKARAMKILTQWASLVPADAAAGAAGAAGAQGAESGGSKKGTPASTPSAKRAKSDAVESDAKAASSPTAEMSEVRSRTRKLLSQALKRPESAASAPSAPVVEQPVADADVEYDEEVISSRVEEHLFEAHADCGTEYRNRARSFSFNLTRNPQLRNLLMSGGITPKQFVAMKPTDMASEELRKKLIEQQKWNLTAAFSELKQEQAVTDEFRCGKCKQRKCTFYQMQTRSADEPMTTFIRCTVCGNRWRQ